VVPPAVCGRRRIARGICIVWPETLALDRLCHREPANRRHAFRALELDESQSAAHAALGMLAF
jgi:hypothetical protein